MQPTFTVFENSKSFDIVREDAVEYRGRLIVPTTEATKWVNSWEEFSAAGGAVHFAEGQYGIELKLPAPYKFDCHFIDSVRGAVHDR